MKKNKINSDAEFDDLIASLFVLITHFSINNNGETLVKIVTRLSQLSEHPHVDLFPIQQMAIAKMQNIWKAKLFNYEMNATPVKAKQYAPLVH